METSVHIKTKVLPGNRIEISSSNLVEGEEVEVIIKSAAKLKIKKRYILDIIKDTTPPHLYKSAEEVDQYLEFERNSWDY